MKHLFYLFFILLSGCKSQIIGHWHATQYYGLDADEEDARLIVFEHLDGLLLIGSTIGGFNDITIVDREEGPGFHIEKPLEDWLCDPIVHESDGLDKLFCKDEDLGQEHVFQRSYLD